MFLLHFFEQFSMLLLDENEFLLIVGICKSGRRLYLRGTMSAA